MFSECKGVLRCANWSKVDFFSSHSDTLWKLSQMLLIIRVKKMIWVIGVLRRTVVCNWRFDNLRGSHFLSQVIVLVLVENSKTLAIYSISWPINSLTSWLRRWLPHRLSKRQSQTTVLQTTEAAACRLLCTKSFNSLPLRFSLFLCLDNSFCPSKKCPRLVKV